LYRVQLTTMMRAERMASAPNAARISVLGCAFFASGAAALAFEALWFRQASLGFGNSVWASSIVLSGFMGGLACGAGLGARYAGRLRNPLRAYALLECGVAISGLTLVWVLPRITPLLAAASARLEQRLWLLNSLRLGSAFSLLLVPAAAMGMALPVLVHALRGNARFGRSFGLLYGINTAGAVLGTCLVDASLVRWLGIEGSALAAAGGSLLAAVLAVSVGRLEPPPIAAAVLPLAAADGSRRWLFAGFVSGFALLGLEVVWLRYLMLFVNDTDQAFAMILVGVLIGIAGGALLASLRPAAPGAAALGAAVSALVLVGSYRLESYAFGHWYRMDQSVFGMSLPLTLPTALASGWLFTTLAHGLRQTLPDDAGAAGRLTMVNTLGGVAGSLVAGFLLLPWLGIEAALLAMTCVYVALAAWLWLRSSRSWLRFASAGACALALLGFPFGSLRPLYLRASVGRWMKGDDRLISVREGVSATYAHVVHGMHGLALFDQLATNAYSMSVNDFAARRYMKQFVYLPRAIHPRIERALVIGYGIGNTVAALIEDASLARLDVVDVSREVFELSRQMRTRHGPAPLDDPRVRVHLEDGRHFLAGHAATYDLITGEPPPPIIAGVVNLYTREYFQLLRAHLSAGGMVSYWLPLMNLSAPAARSLIAGFCAAFADCSLWHGSARNFMLLGTQGALGPVTPTQFGAQWRSASATELRDVGFELPEQLGATFIGDAAYLGAITQDSAPLSDDRPKRISTAGPLEERDALIWSWRDTAAARRRFEASPLIAKLWPSEMRRATLRQFENQRLLNDLLFPESTPVRQTRILHQVLHGTPLHLPVLLMLGSDPDIQRALAKTSADVSNRPEWLMHHAAGFLAQRDFAAALPYLRRVPSEALPLPDIVDYVEFVSARLAAERELKPSKL
jgi:spermidine synthase